MDTASPAGPRRAVVDIGTNSVKLLVVELGPEGPMPILEQSRQTRLGEGFYAAHRLQPGPIALTATAVAEFAALARTHGAPGIRVIATSAARDARNQEELLQAITLASGLKVEIISGDQEAEWAFQGVTSSPLLAGQRLLILDLGGGSAEFILGEHGHRQFSRSYQLGCVRLLERLAPPDAPTPADLAQCRDYVYQFLATHVSADLRSLWSSQATAPLLVGTGGTVTILGRLENRMTDFDRTRLETTELTVDSVRNWVDRLWSLPLMDRRRLTGLPANRADVILMGSVVYEQVMETFHLPALRLSTRGLRFAAAMAGV
ncbi:MAG: Ppx/GppA phosphatase family protein [Verrucomicrobiota bacterium]